MLIYQLTVKSKQTTVNVRLRALYKFLLQNGSYFTPSHLSEVLGEAWSFQVVKDSLSAGRLSPLTVEVGAAALLGLIGWGFFRHHTALKCFS